MQTTERTANPLGLTVWTERPCDLIPYNEADRPGDLAAITASMEANGWQGAPLVIDDRGLESGGQLLTGSHRHAAATALGIDVPLVSVSDLASALGIDLDSYDYGYGTEWEQVFGEIPADIRSTYGIDL